ncbi:hypothetical protein IV38_GL000458 [Lactobacillus selangorensis]|uniref:Peptidase C39-like domain-containing protein n=1 Tax=Lactobacillus selangorensis TaxID=81857 RepID=A0A0R2FXC0_9LACO|nr:C39 family peptidase [Lactobacillus selangorensis]KRN29572.1 hypothetical protein IV38_GL000458 [Lactobacillus selangorensis]KRN33898.1 hypothetical protein IV40_GL000210 [Lactobacillus selangorensis]
MKHARPHRKWPKWLFGLVLAVLIVGVTIAVVQQPTSNQAATASSQSASTAQSKPQKGSPISLKQLIAAEKKKWVQFTGKNKVTTKDPVADQTAADAPKYIMQVKPLSQFPDLPTGCEITDVAMLMQYRNKSVSALEIANEIPYTDDPETGFWGDPTNDTGYTMYPPAWKDYFENNLGSFKDLSGASLSTLKTELKNDHPIVAWVEMHGFGQHAILLIGYQGNNLIYNDPYTGKGDQKISQSDFWSLAASQHHRAMTD